MNKIILKSIFTVSTLLAVTTSCVKDDEFETPRIGESLISEDFQAHSNNVDVDLAGWTNFAESGTWKWRRKEYQGNGYAEFSAFGSGSVNKVWLISPALDLDMYVKDGVSFKVAKHHLDIDSPSNSVLVYISTDYDGVNVLTANWTKLSANIPTTATANYAFLPSNINLSAYSGIAHVAFVFTGDGNTSNLDGAFQFDDFNFYKQE